MAGQAARTEHIESQSDLDVIEFGSTSPSTVRLSFSMKNRDAFYSRIASQLRHTLTDDLTRFTARPMFNIMKVWYDNERVHYEVGVDVTRRLLEVALHFEDGPVSTLGYLKLLDREIVALKHRLGPEIELERWTTSWGRLYEIWPLNAIDQDVADSVAARLSQYISVLQPIIETSGIRPERPARSI